MQLPNLLKTMQSTVITMQELIIDHTTKIGVMQMQRSQMKQKLG